MTNAQQSCKPLQDATAPLQKARPSTSRISSATIERLFDRLASFYGTRFGDLWRGCDISNVKQAWAEALSLYSVEELKKGLDGCRTRAFAPNLPEFLILCRPPINFESAFYEACEQLQQRQNGNDQWSHPAIYWAAVTVHFDMRHATWAAIKSRWTAVLQSELDKGQWPEIPPANQALPQPGQTFARPEDVLDQLENFDIGKNIKNHRQWALDIMELWNAGSYTHHVGYELACTALGIDPKNQPQRITRKSKNAGKEGAGCQAEV